MWHVSDCTHRAQVACKCGTRQSHHAVFCQQMQLTCSASDWARSQWGGQESLATDGTQNTTHTSVPHSCSLMWTAPSEAQLLQAVDYGYPQARERHYLLGYRLAEEGGRAARHSAARQSTADAFRTMFLSPKSAPPEAVGVGVVMLCSAPPEALGVGVVMLCLRAGPQQVHQNSRSTHCL